MPARKQTGRGVKEILQKYRLVSRPLRALGNMLPVGGHIPAVLALVAHMKGYGRKKKKSTYKRK